MGVENIWWRTCGQLGIEDMESGQECEMKLYSGIIVDKWKYLVEDMSLRVDDRR